ncbi:uncharacterized protein LOC119767771 [Culex quinquefasciatus]|uniref:uncharacterized protein LOC119767771 n=1 Tax=Culex quinquefasciatus TaxID=7176 RepID=UPI0018E34BE8|nr:uncharacterized protein LOC119767771 [Culex quinquefasciatus]
MLNCEIKTQLDSSKLSPRRSVRWSCELIREKVELSLLFCWSPFERLTTSGWKQWFMLSLTKSQSIYAAASSHWRSMLSIPMVRFAQIPWCLAGAGLPLHSICDTWTVCSVSVHQAEAKRCVFSPWSADADLFRRCKQGNSHAKIELDEYWFKRHLSTLFPRSSLHSF